MKKQIASLALSLVLLVSGTYAKANDGKVPTLVTNQFQNDFSFTGQVKWEKIDFYYKANFNQQGTASSAFYTSEGDFMGTGNCISVGQLPEVLRTAVRSQYQSYWITDLFSYSNGETIGYVVTLENAGQQLMLRADGTDHWTLYKTVRKS